jgi:20S proteasome subunit beta 3
MLYGACEALYRPNLGPEELFETISQAILAATDRDCTAGWGAIVHVITPTEVITKIVKGRMD